MREQEWLRHLLTVSRRALNRLREHPTPENQSLEKDLERYARELETRLRRTKPDRMI
jgi:hypothetical protein